MEALVLTIACIGIYGIFIWSMRTELDEQNAASREEMAARTRISDPARGFFRDR